MRYLLLFPLFFLISQCLITLPLERVPSPSLSPRLLQEETSLSLTNVFNIHYNIKIFIGTPLKEFRLILDTGSNWLWVGSASCQGCYRIGIGDLYYCEGSQTCIEEKLPEIEVKYGIGYVKGFATKDLVSFDENATLAVQGQEFLQIEEIQEIDQLKAQGILGIGRKGYGSNSGNTFIENLKAQKKIEKLMFSLYLLGHECQEDSKVVIGGYDEDLFEGSITYANVISDEFWNIPIESVYFSWGNQTQTIDSVYKTALIDSGSSDIVMKSKDIQQIINYFDTLQIECELVENYQGVLQLTCGESDENQYPEFHVMINNTDFSLKPNDYIASCYFKYFKYRCRLHFIVDNTLEIDQIIILGENFLNAYYSIYDLENNRIGLAKAQRFDDSQAFSVKDSLFKIFILIVAANIMLFFVEFLCVKIKLCAKIEGINCVESFSKKFTLYPDVLVDGLDEKNEH